MKKPRSTISISNPCLSVPESTPTIQSALIQWKTARTFLSSTIQSYLAVCATLRASYAGTLVYQSNGQDTIKEALATICTELESLASEEQLLYNARVSFATVISNSVTLPNVNRLPPEILARVFKFSRTFCARDDIYWTNGPTDVCRYWRQVALDTAHLWTHIDIGPDIPTNRTKLLLNRSKHAPVHIHVLETLLEREVAEPDEYESEHAARKMMKMLAPHLHRVRTLNVKSNSRGGNFFLALLDSWSHCDTANSLMSLRLEQAALVPVLRLLEQGGTSESLERMLLALTSLRLFDTMFSRDSSAYRGLVDLQLLFSDYDDLLSMSDLAGILAASPGLTTLKLDGLEVDQRNWTQLTPIVMRCLEFVSLVELRQADAAAVLSLITLPGPRAELAIRLSHASTLDSRVAEFFARSRITTLLQASHDCDGECDGCSNGLDCEGDPFKATRLFPQYLPHIHTLILDGFYLRSSPVNQSSTLALPASLWPRLQKLILVDCRVDFEDLKRLVYEIGVQSLCFEQRTTKFYRAGPDQSRQELQMILASLQGLYPHLHYHMSSIDGTEQLERHTGFLYRGLY